MKKFYFLILSMLLGMSSFLGAQQNTYTKVFYLADFVSGIQVSSMVRSFDSNYMIAGSAEDQALVMKMDQNGGILWAKRMNFGNARTQITGIIPTHDQCFAMCGFLDTEILLLMKINASGDTLWSKSVEPGEEKFLCSVIETADHGYLLTGVSGQSVPYYYHKTHLIKLDSAGNLSWSKNIGSGINFQTNSTVATADNGYMLYGTKTDGLNETAAVIKLSAAGDILWSKSMQANPSANSEGLDVVSNDSGFLFLSYTHPSPPSIAYTSIIQTDPSANVIWSKTSNPQITHLVPISDGGCILISEGYFGTIYKMTAGGEIAWAQSPRLITVNALEAYDEGLIVYGNGPILLVGGTDYYGPQIGIYKTDSLGQTNACNEPGFASSDTCSDSFVTFSLSNAVSATVSSGIHPEITVLTTLQSDECIEIIGGIDEKNNGLKLNVFPNPVTSTAEVSLEGAANGGELNAVLYDINGKPVQSTCFSGKSFQFSKGSLSPGQYFLRIIDENGRVAGVATVVIL